jgi:hypothetical protein
MSTYLTQRQNIGRMEKHQEKHWHADTDLHIKANGCERQCGHLSHRQCDSPKGFATENCLLEWFESIHLKQVWHHVTPFLLDDSDVHLRSLFKFLPGRYRNVTAKYWRAFSLKRSEGIFYRCIRVETTVTSLESL